MIIQAERSYIPARNVGPLSCRTEGEIKSLAMDCINGKLHSLGITITPNELEKMTDHAISYYSSLQSSGMDADLVAPVTTASITTPVQFLQAWLPGFVEDVTAARKIDELVGVVTQGSWEDEEVVQGILERAGDPQLYGDYTNIPLSSWNVNYVRRTIVRFEEGMQVGRLEEMRAAAIRTNSAENKRAAAARALEVERNRIGFNGFNSGNNRTYGFLNDPQLPAFVTVATGVGGVTWALKTFLEIVSDLLTAYAQLRTQSQDIIDPTSDPITLAVATDAVDRLATVSQFGNSVMDWINKTYPKTRIVSAPELNDGNGSSVGVFYMYAETVSDTGSDDNRTFIQVVPNKFLTLGVDQRAKDYVEDYANATAGIMTKRPYAVVRYSGIS